MESILLLTSDNFFGEKLKRLLEDSGYKVSLFRDVNEVIENFQQTNLDLLLFDLDFLTEKRLKDFKQLRKEDRFKELPVIVLIQKDSLPNLNFMLEIDDFILKDSDLLELKLRLQKIFWCKGKVSQENTVNIGELVIDFNNYQVLLKGNPISLTYREYELLKFFILNQDKVFTREMLLDRVWGYDNYVGTRTVDIHVQRLRTKLGSIYGKLIQTVRNVGYKFSI